MGRSAAREVVTGMQSEPPVRPKLTSRALRRWMPPLVRHLPALASAYLLPGRVPPRIREAAMLGVTSINRCEACEAVHDRWAKDVGLQRDAFTPGEDAAYAFGQRVAASGPHEAPPVEWRSRHRRELVAVSILMELANLAGNRFLAPRAAARGPQVGNLRTARVLDAGMRAADRLGLRRVRARVVGGARGDVLEIGIGTGSNLEIYAAGTVVHGIDVSAPALSLAARRAVRRVTLVEGDAAALPFADASFDTVVATFVLCSVADVGAEPARGPQGAAPGGHHPTARARPCPTLGDRCAPGALGAGMGSGQRWLPARPRRARGRAGRRSHRDRGTAASRRAPRGDRRRLMSPPDCVPGDRRGPMQEWVCRLAHRRKYQVSLGPTEAADPYRFREIRPPDPVAGYRDATMAGAGHRPGDGQSSRAARVQSRATSTTEVTQATIPVMNVSMPVPCWVRHDAPAGRGFVPWR